MDGNEPENWKLRGACRSKPQDWFFPERENDANIARAKATCAQCEVREPCLAEGLADPGLKGIWGGTTDQERMRIRLFNWIVELPKAVDG